MPRLFLSLILVAAVILIGAVPRGVMAHWAGDVMPCHQAMQPTSAVDHCAAEKSAPSGACGVICLGSVADWPQPAITLPVRLHHVVPRRAVPLVLRGRQTNPDDRPPKSI